MNEVQVSHATPLENVLDFYGGTLTKQQQSDRTFEEFKQRLLFDEGWTSYESDLDIDEPAGKLDNL